jgi:hypothetical protein
VVVAALVALPIGAVAAPSAQAEVVCTPMGPVQVCGEGGAVGGIGLDIPGVIHLCIRLSSFCGT